MAAGRRGGGGLEDALRSVLQRCAKEDVGAAAGMCAKDRVLVLAWRDTGRLFGTVASKRDAALGFASRPAPAGAGQAAPAHTFGAQLGSLSDHVRILLCPTAPAVQHTHDSNDGHDCSARVEMLLEREPAARQPAPPRRRSQTHERRPLVAVSANRVELSPYLPRAKPQPRVKRRSNSAAPAAGAPTFRVTAFLRLHPATVHMVTELLLSHGSRRHGITPLHVLSAEEARASFLHSRCLCAAVSSGRCSDVSPGRQRLESPRAAPGCCALPSNGQLPSGQQRLASSDTRSCSSPNRAQPSAPRWLANSDLVPSCLGAADSQSPSSSSPGQSSAPQWFASSAHVPACLGATDDCSSSNSNPRRLPGSQWLANSRGGGDLTSSTAHPPSDGAAVELTGPCVHTSPPVHWLEDPCGSTDAAHVAQPPARSSVRQTQQTRPVDDSNAHLRAQPSAQWLEDPCGSTDRVQQTAPVDGSIHRNARLERGLRAQPSTQRFGDRRERTGSGPGGSAGGGGAGPSVRTRAQHSTPDERVGEASSDPAAPCQLELGSRGTSEGAASAASVSGGLSGVGGARPSTASRIESEALSRPPPAVSASDAEERAQETGESQPAQLSCAGVETRADPTSPSQQQFPPTEREAGAGGAVLGEDGRQVMDEVRPARLSRVATATEPQADLSSLGPQRAPAGMNTCQEPREDGPQLMNEVQPPQLSRLAITSLGSPQRAPAGRSTCQEPREEGPPLTNGVQPVQTATVPSQQREPAARNTCGGPCAEEVATGCPPHALATKTPPGSGGASSSSWARQSTDPVKCPGGARPVPVATASGESDWLASTTPPPSRGGAEWREGSAERTVKLTVTPPPSACKSATRSCTAPSPGRPEAYRHERTTPLPRRRLRRDLMQAEAYAARLSTSSAPVDNAELEHTVACRRPSVQTDAAVSIHFGTEEQTGGMTESQPVQHSCTATDAQTGQASVGQRRGSASRLPPSDAPCGEVGATHSLPRALQPSTSAHCKERTPEQRIPQSCDALLPTGTRGRSRRSSLSSLGRSFAARCGESPEWGSGGLRVFRGLELAFAQDLLQCSLCFALLYDEAQAATGGGYVGFVECDASEAKVCAKCFEEHLQDEIKRGVEPSRIHCPCQGSRSDLPGCPAFISAVVLRSFLPQHDHPPLSPASRLACARCDTAIERRPPSAKPSRGSQADAEPTVVTCEGCQQISCLDCFKAHVARSIVEPNAHQGNIPCNLSIGGAHCCSACIPPALVQQHAAPECFAMMLSRGLDAAVSCSLCSRPVSEIVGVVSPSAQSVSIVQCDACGLYTCKACFKRYAARCIAAGAATVQAIPCPYRDSPAACKAQAPERVLRAVLDDGELEMLARRTVDAAIESAGNKIDFVRCPCCGVVTEVDTSRAAAQLRRIDEQSACAAGLGGGDEGRSWEEEKEPAWPWGVLQKVFSSAGPKPGPPADSEEWVAVDGWCMKRPHARAFVTSRLRCGNCSTDFCKQCLSTPYHLHKTCEEHRHPRQCRYCSDPVREQDIPVSTHFFPAHPSSHPASTSSSFEAASSKPSFFQFLHRRHFKPKAVAPPSSSSSSCSSSVSAAAPPAHAFVCAAAECRALAANACARVLPCGHSCAGVRGEERCPPCLVAGCDAHGRTSDTGDDFCPICWTEPLAAAPAVQLPCSHFVHHACLAQRLAAKWPAVHISFAFMNCPVCQRPVTHADPALSRLLAPLLKLRKDLESRWLERLRIEGLHSSPLLVQPGQPFYRRPLDFAASVLNYYQCSKCDKAYFGGLRRCDAEQNNDRDWPNRDDLICGACVDKTECPVHGSTYIQFKCRYCCHPAVWFCWGTTHFCDSCHQTIARPTPVCPGPEECPSGGHHPPNGQEFSLGCVACKERRTGDAAS